MIGFLLASLIVAATWSWAVARSGQPSPGVRSQKVFEWTMEIFCAPKFPGVLGIIHVVGMFIIEKALKLEEAAKI